jgi:hypothetical protein
MSRRTSDWIVDRMHRRHKQVSVLDPSGSSTGRARPASGASALLRGGWTPFADWDGLRDREPALTTPGRSEERVGPRGATGWMPRPRDPTTPAGTGAWDAGR